MKKIFTTITLVCLFALATFAQGNFILSGTVVNTIGNPVPNQTVWISTDSSQTSFVYYNSVSTDSMGMFTVGIPNGCVTGPNIVFDVATYSCGTYLYQQVQNNQGTTCSASVTFSVCSTTLSCATTLYGIPDSTVNPYNFFFIGYPTINGTIVNASSYSWDFGDGSPLSTQASPTHTYAALGNYTVCLTTTTTTGCTSTSCTTVSVTPLNPCNVQFGYQAQPAGSQTSFNALIQPNYQYAWTFGDGTSGTGPNPTHIYALPGLYQVCLTVSNPISGCTNSVCYNVSIQPAVSTHWLYGQVTLPAMGMLTPADFGTVYLVRYDSLLLTAIDTTSIDSNGYYFFSGVPAGAYLVKAALSPNSAYYANYLPTYYTSSLFWTTATNVLVMNTNVSNANINMIAGNNPGGPGFIGGSVLQGANRLASPGDPIVGLSILLLDINNNPVASTTTDINGSYSFPSLAYGTYKIYAEVAGKTTVPSIVTIDAANPTVNNVNIEVNSGTILFVRNEIAQAPEVKFSIYPNPALNTLYIALAAKESSKVRIDINNSLGQLIQSAEYKLNAGNNNIAQSIDNLVKGVYAITIIENGKSATTRFVKAQD